MCILHVNMFHAAVQRGCTLETLPRSGQTKNDAKDDESKLNYQLYILLKVSLKYDFCMSKITSFNPLHHVNPTFPFPIIGSGHKVDQSYHL